MEPLRLFGQGVAFRNETRPLSCRGSVLGDGLAQRSCGAFFSRSPSAPASWERRLNSRGRPWTKYQPKFRWSRPYRRITRFADEKMETPKKRIDQLFHSLLFRLRETECLSNNYLVLSAMSVSDSVQSSEDDSNPSEVHSRFSKIWNLELFESTFLFFEEELVRPRILGHGHFILVLPATVQLVDRTHTHTYWKGLLQTLPRRIRNLV